MEFKIDKAIEVLSNTPKVISAQLDSLSHEWINAAEGGGTWSAFDIVGHLIHGEKTDWIPRASLILSNKPEKVYESFDRFAQFEDSQGKTLDQLLDEFEKLRTQNLKKLRGFSISSEDLAKEATHPDLGITNLKQLLSSWVVHDLSHIAQIARIMAKQYKYEVGPWKAYINFLNK